MEKIPLVCLSTGDFIATGIWPGIIRDNTTTSLANGCRTLPVFLCMTIKGMPLAIDQSEKYGQDYINLEYLQLGPRLA